MAVSEHCPGCGAPDGYPPAGPCFYHGTPRAFAASAACPRCGDPGYLDMDGRHYCGNARCGHTDEIPR